MLAAEVQRQARAREAANQRSRENGDDMQQFGSEDLDKEQELNGSQQSQARNPVLESDESVRDVSNRKRSWAWTAEQAPSGGAAPSNGATLQSSPSDQIVQYVASPTESGSTMNSVCKSPQHFELPVEGARARAGSPEQPSSEGSCCCWKRRRVPRRKMSGQRLKSFQVAIARASKVLPEKWRYQPEPESVSEHEDELTAEDLVREAAADPKSLKKYLTVVRGTAALVSDVHKRGQKPKWILNPRSAFIRSWDLVTILLLLFTAVVTPYEVAFLNTSPAEFLFWVNRLVDVCFVVDIVFNFFLMFYDEDSGRWVYDKQTIAKRYLRGWFLIDIISIVPFDVISAVSGEDSLQQFQAFRTVRLFRLFKLLRVFRASRIIQRWKSTLSVKNSTVSLLRFFMTVLFISHWSACVWGIVPTLQSDGSPSWTDTALNLDTSAPGEVYVAALYWSVMTLTTIGYGDVITTGVGERVLAIFLMFLGGSIYAYVVGAICSIVTNMDVASTVYYQALDDLNRYMHELRLPTDLQIRLREYFQHCQQLHRNKHYQGLLLQMSPTLRGEVAMHSHGKWVRKVWFFNAPRTRERESFVSALSVVLMPMAFAPLEEIIKFGEGTHVMYIIQRGLIVSRGRVMGGGRFFGEDMILTNERRNYTARSMTFVDAYSLTKQSLSKALRSADFAATTRMIRRAAIILALRREIIRMAHQARLERGFLDSLAAPRSSVVGADMLTAGASPTTRVRKPKHVGKVTSGVVGTPPAQPARDSSGDTCTEHDQQSVTMASTTKSTRSPSPASQRVLQAATQSAPADAVGTTASPAKAQLRKRPTLSPIGARTPSHGAGQQQSHAKSPQHQQYPFRDTGGPTQSLFFGHGSLDDEDEAADDIPGTTATIQQAPSDRLPHPSEFKASEHTTVRPPTAMTDQVSGVDAVRYLVQQFNKLQGSQAEITTMLEQTMKEQYFGVGAAGAHGHGRLSPPEAARTDRDVLHRDVAMLKKLLIVFAVVTITLLGVIIGLIASA